MRGWVLEISCPIKSRQIVPGKNNAVAIELVCTHIRRELERRSRHFRQDMVGSLSLEPSLARGPAKEPSTEEIGLTVLEQTPQLKVVVFHVWSE